MGTVQWPVHPTVATAAVTAAAQGRPRAVVWRCRPLRLLVRSAGPHATLCASDASHFLRQPRALGSRPSPAVDPRHTTCVFIHHPLI